MKAFAVDCDEGEFRQAADGTRIAEGLGRSIAAGATHLGRT